LAIGNIKLAIGNVQLAIIILPAIIFFISLETVRLTVSNLKLKIKFDHYEKED